MDLEISKICRCCMEHSENMKNIHDKCNFVNDNVEIMKMFEICLENQFNLDENFPTNICLKCLEELITSYKFKRKCEVTTLKLQEYFSYLKKISLEPLKPNMNEIISNSDDKKVSLNVTEKTDSEIHDSNIESEHDSLGEENVPAEPSVQLKPAKNDFAVNEKNVCQICCKVFMYTSSLVMHMKRHNGVKNYKCQTCTKAFTTSSSLKVHMLSHTGERSFECQECKKCFATKDALQKHSRKHTGERLHLCSFCGKGYGTSGTLQTHMRIHSGDKPLKCNICDMSFAAHAGLVVHLRKHTGERPYLCSQCGKGFKSSSDLTSHMRKHTGERPYACDLCEKSFRTSYMRSVHRRIHTGEKPAQCDICKKCFTSNGHLTSHLRTHLEVKPHSCEVCEKNFSTLRDLTLHSMVHTGVKPHICPTCGKGFNRSNNYQKHMRLHTGIKPHVCEICKYAFGTSTQLTIHIRSHTGERPYCCKNCEKTFSSSSGLARHVKRAHWNKSRDAINTTTKITPESQKIPVENSSLENMCENKLTEKNLSETQDILAHNILPANQFCDPKAMMALNENELQDTINIVESFEIVDGKIESGDKMHYEMLQNVQTDGLKIDSNLISDAQIMGMPSIASMFIPISRSSVDDIFKCKYT